MRRLTTQPPERFQFPGTSRRAMSVQVINGVLYHVSIQLGFKTVVTSYAFRHMVANALAAMNRSLHE